MTLQAVVYDIEDYPNFFCIGAKDYASGYEWQYEISDRINQVVQLLEFLWWLRDNKWFMIGFNNEAYDWLIMNIIIRLQHFVTNTDLFNENQRIFAQPRGEFRERIWFRDQVIKQIDLFLMHHFNNMSRATSLKALEMKMRSRFVKDLPFKPGTVLQHWQKDVVLAYNMHDVRQTHKFAHASEEEMMFRYDISEEWGQPFYSDDGTKIGEKYLIMKLEQAKKNTCYYYDSVGKRQKRQTPRPQINLAEVIYPYIWFEHPEFNRILNVLKSKTIRQTKGVFEKLIAEVDGVEYKFGTGGIHGSVKRRIFHSDNNKVILDIDVGGYYPSNIAVNGLYPQHLGPLFSQIVNEIISERKKYPKTSPINKAMKLAGNGGAFGKSNDKNSVIFDPKYFMTITINGQLMVCMLIEQLLKLPGLEVIQANTDGITLHIPRQYIPHFREICQWWSNHTKLILEESTYKSMWVRDVNSYLAVKEDGSCKRIGAYAFVTPLDDPNTKEREWHKDHSMLGIRKAACEHLISGRDIREILEANNDPFDFMMMKKASGDSELLLRDEQGNEASTQRTTRYFVSLQGQELIKKSPPKEGYEIGDFCKKNGVTEETYHAQNITGLWNPSIHTKNGSTYQIRYENQQAGFKVTECNDAADFNWANLDMDFYVNEAEKLVIK